MKDNIRFPKRVIFHELNSIHTFKGMEIKCIDRIATKKRVNNITHISYKYGCDDCFYNNYYSECINFACSEHHDFRKDKKSVIFIRVFQNQE